MWLWLGCIALIWQNSHTPTVYSPTPLQPQTPLIRSPTKYPIFRFRSKYTDMVGPLRLTYPSKHRRTWLIWVRNEGSIALLQWLLQLRGLYFWKTNQNETHAIDWIKANDRRAHRWKPRVRCVMMPAHNNSASFTSLWSWRPLVVGFRTAVMVGNVETVF